MGSDLTPDEEPSTADEPSSKPSDSKDTKKPKPATKDDGSPISQSECDRLEDKVWDKDNGYCVSKDAREPGSNEDQRRFGHVTRAKTRNWVGSFLPLMFSASCSFIFAGTERGKGRIRENEAESLRGVIRENGSKKLGLPWIQQRLRATRNLARFQLASFVPESF